jgi:hypothetical protein
MVPSSRNHLMNAMPLCCIIYHILTPHFLQCCHHAIVTRKHINKPKKERHTDNFQEDVICKTVLENDNKGQSQKVTLVLWEKTAYRGFIHILFI